MSEQPGWSPIRLRCKKCGHPWNDWQPTLVPLITWIAHVRAFHCPTCGADSHNIVPRVDAADE